MDKKDEEDIEHVLEPELGGEDETLSGQSQDVSGEIPSAPVADDATEGASLKGKTRAGTLWSAIERFSVQGVTFIVLLVMARLLTPDDYGIVGMIAIFIEVAQSLVDSGFSQALIRKTDRTEVDNSTVFYFNIVVGLALYAILFFTAPLIARFYDKPEVTPVLIPMIRLLGLSIVINSFVVVQRALFTIKLDFKSQAKASLGAALSSGFVGIGMALGGCGVWSIAGQQLTNLTVNVGILWILSGWRPKAMYSWKSFRYLFGFGSKLAAAGVLETIYRNIYNIAIGKKFLTDQLGYYTRAQQFGNFLSSNVTGVLQRVTFPVLCSLQDDDTRLADIYRRFLRLSAFVIFPLMIGLAALAHPLILVLLKEKWIFTAGLLQVLCLAMMWYPVHAINLNLLMVKGRSDLFLGLEVAKKVVGITVMFITIPMGLMAICWGQVFNSLLALAINTHYTGKLIGVGLLKQLRDLLPTLFYSFSMGLIVWGMTSLLSADWLRLLIGFPMGVAYYFTAAYLTRSSDLRELISFIRKK
ncbi:MAG: lipopolysaccharide biosynthesis protein [Muribaculaceae bacterium]|nr:lipopolysaccharide biosynthesis protein [Muribaculaceae bacterium]